MVVFSVWVEQKEGSWSLRGVEVCPSPTIGRLTVEDLLLFPSKGVDSSLYFIFRPSVVGLFAVEMLVVTDLENGEEDI